MDQYLAPGVYVEEKSSTPPIVVAGTSTVVYIGVVLDDVPIAFHAWIV